MTIKQLMRHVRIDAAGHWLWTGAIQERTGYGMVRYPTGTSDPITAHRAFKLASGDHVPAGYDVHHLEAFDCPKHCVNPDHTAVITEAAHRERHNPGWWW